MLSKKQLSEAKKLFAPGKKPSAPTPPVKLDPKYNTMAEEMNAVVKRLDTTLTPPRGYKSGKVSMKDASKVFARKPIK